jgi:hypothetical protein
MEDWVVIQLISLVASPVEGLVASPVGDPAANLEEDPEEDLVEDQGINSKEDFRIDWSCFLHFPGSIARMNCYSRNFWKGAAPFASVCEGYYASVLEHWQYYFPYLPEQLL